MHNIRKINADLYYVGVSDRKLALFENIYPIPRGVSYNSYVLMDDKTVLLDTVDAAVGSQFIENLKYVLNGRGLDYLVVNHMEPDHCALLEDVVLRWPEVKIVTNVKAAGMIRQFFDFDLDSRLVQVSEGDILNTGRHTLHFVMAPMVHWPEVMVTYDELDKSLFSADAFGTFGALNGNIYADEVNFDRDWLDDARRYLVNIVGKYGPQIQALLKKAAGLDIEMICPLHGPIWRENLGYYIEKYDKWSKYEAEENGVLIVYGSIYGHTEVVASVLANKLAERGVKGIAMYDASHTDVSELVSEAFKYSNIVVAAPTYNGDIYTPIETWLTDLKHHNLQNRKWSIIENGTWASVSGKQMHAMIEGMKNMAFVGETMTVKSAMKACQEDALNQLAEEIVKSL